MGATNNCLMCKWAVWEMTKHNPPRVKNGSLGKCLYPMARVAVPATFQPVSYHDTTPEILERLKSHIFRDRPYENCRVWEKRDE